MQHQDFVLSVATAKGTSHNYLALTVTTPTIEPNSPECLKRIILTHTGYQVIPFNPSQNYDVYEYIAHILPATKYF